MRGLHYNTASCIRGRDWKRRLKDERASECRGSSVLRRGAGRDEGNASISARERIAFTQNTRLIGMALRQFPTITGEGGSGIVS